ncbi:hemocyanin D chain [Trichonephila clavipes]|nr:hemocyanin D chain [Trichonephila clavipes]
MADMSVKEKQNQILPLFKNLTALPPETLPEAERMPVSKGWDSYPEIAFSLVSRRTIWERLCTKDCTAKAKDFNDFLNLAKQARNIINEGLFAFVLSVTVQHRDDCQGVILLPTQEVFPDRFIPAEIINRAFKADKKSTNESKDFGNAVTLRESLDQWGGTDKESAEELGSALADFKSHRNPDFTRGRQPKN